jgi:hypothetical protein
MDAGSDLDTIDRAWHRFREEPLGVDVGLDLATKGSGIQDFATMIAKRMYVAPVSPSIGITTSHDDITFIQGEDGRKVNVEAATAKIGQAVIDGRTHLTLQTKVIAPKETEATVGRTIVVRLNENRLYGRSVPTRSRPPSRGSPRRPASGRSMTRRRTPPGTTRPRTAGVRTCPP